MGRFIRVREGVQFQPVVRQAFGAQRDLGKVGAHLRVELVAIHAQIARRIQVPDEAGLDLLDAHACGNSTTHTHGFARQLPAPLMLFHRWR
jgi:hypothetical protein